MRPEGIQLAIRRLAEGRSLSLGEARAAFEQIMHGEATPAQVAALLMGLRVKGETPEEVAGVAQALRAAMLRIEAERPEDLVDTCGTGGGSVPTFNISTGAAFVAAGAGARIAKHGNRSFTSRCGSADVLEALGIPLDVSPDKLGGVLREAGIVFMFAPAMHPAMKHVGPVRRELAVQTVMNIVGPLANPAGAARQVVGVAERGRLELMAGALAALGTKHALVVHGEPGLDEISPLGQTHVLEVKSGEIRRWTLDPGELGFPRFEPEHLAGGSPEENARLIVEVLAGKGSPAATAAVLLNSAAALLVAGLARDLADGLARSRQAIETGRAALALERMRAAYRRASAQ
jgi:anthranilate phosphoribosyltransferase